MMKRVFKELKSKVVSFNFEMYNFFHVIFCANDFEKSPNFGNARLKNIKLLQLLNSQIIDAAAFLTFHWLTPFIELTDLCSSWHFSSFSSVLASLSLNISAWNWELELNETFQAFYKQGCYSTLDLTKLDSHLQWSTYETEIIGAFWDLLWHKTFVCINCETHLALECAHKWPWPTGFEKSEIHQLNLEKWQF